jgi:hypothetical protein
MTQDALLDMKISILLARAQVMPAVLQAPQLTV